MIIVAGRKYKTRNGKFTKKVEGKDKRKGIPANYAFYVEIEGGDFPFYTTKDGCYFTHPNGPPHHHDLVEEVDAGHLNPMPMAPAPADPFGFMAAPPGLRDRVGELAREDLIPNVGPGPQGARHPWPGGEDPHVHAGAADLERDLAHWRGGEDPLVGGIMAAGAAAPEDLGARPVYNKTMWFLFMKEPNEPDEMCDYRTYSDKAAAIRQMKRLRDEDRLLVDIQEVDFEIEFKNPNF